jgi:CubicO group peptidase (beta-lactamase class C family)
MKNFGFSTMKFLLIAMCLVSSAGLAAQTKSAAAAETIAPVVPGRQWSVAESPEKAGWSSEKLKVAREYGDAIGSEAVMIVQDGVVIGQWGETSKKLNSYSMRKSLLSSLYGIYVKEGKIDINVTLEQLGIDDNPPSLTKEEKQARVVDLLRARSGVYHPALFETPHMKEMRPARGSHAPGTFWYYNNWDFNALGTIFETKTGLSIGQAFAQRIAAPLQMEDYRADDVYFIRGADSIHPAYPFHISARDLARFGLLYLRRGRWGEKQIVPEAWVNTSTHPVEDLGNFGGAPFGDYEYLWWVAIDGKKHLPGADLGAGAFSARGAGGHYIVVLPAYHLVVVHRVNNGDFQASVVSGEQMGHLMQLILDARPR